METYEGAVYYRDGWHWSTDDRKLYLEDDGTYRYATDTDQSWHDRHHRQYVTLELT